MVSQQWRARTIKGEGEQTRGAALLSRPLQRERGSGKDPNSDELPRHVPDKG